MLLVPHSDPSPHIQWVWTTSGLWQASSPEALSQAKAALLQELGTYTHLPLQQTLAEAGWMKWEFKRLPSFLEGKPAMSCNWRSRTPHGISLSLAFGLNYILGPHLLLLTSLVICSQAMLSWEKAASCSVCFPLLPSRASTSGLCLPALSVYSMDLAEGVPFSLSVSGHVHTCVCDVCQGPGLQQYSGSSHSGLESLSVRLRMS